MQKYSKIDSKLITGLNKVFIRKNNFFFNCLQKVLWGCFSSSGPGLLFKLEDRDGEKYTGILDKNPFQSEKPQKTKAWMKLHLSAGKQSQTQAKVTQTRLNPKRSTVTKSRWQSTNSQQTTSNQAETDMSAKMGKNHSQWAKLAGI